jgi:protein tyrosine phosphatase (PTP) superfamily phosphohydrolase (DUF442 family)
MLRNHAEIYATPGLPPFQYDRVAPRVWAGRNPLTALDVQALRREGITHILDLRQPEEWAPPRFGEEALLEIERLGLVRRHLPITDMGAPLSSDLDEAVSFLEAVLAEPRTGVYVHCRAGMERTAAVLVAWWVKRHGCSYEAALAALREGRPILRPLPVQEAAVRNWLSTFCFT